MRLKIFKSATEEELIEQCKNNSSKAQHLLFEKYAPKMMGVCMRYAGDKDTAEDLMINSFMKVFEKLDQFKKEGSFEGWIRRIMVNDCLSYIRKNKGMYLEVELEEAEYQLDYNNLSDHLETEDLINLVNELPSGYKMVFNLYAIEGFTHQEIAEKLKITIGTSKSQLNRARKHLQSKLAQLEIRELNTNSHGK